jgi:hypothetical protein
VIEIALALSSLGAVFFTVVLTAFAIGAWRVVYEVGLLVAAHLVNLGKVTLGQLDPDRSVGEKIWFAILLIGSAAALLAGEPLRGFTPERWAATAGLFLLLAFAAGLIEYIRYMVKWRGVLFAAWDLLAWIGTVLAGFALIALLATLAKGCYDAIRPGPGDERSRDHAAVRGKPLLPACPEGAQACSRGQSEAAPPECSLSLVLKPRRGGGRSHEASPVVNRSTELPPPFQGLGDCGVHSPGSPHLRCSDPGLHASAPSDQQVQGDGLIRRFDLCDPALARVQQLGKLNLGHAFLLPKLSHGTAELEVEIHIGSLVGSHAQELLSGSSPSLPGLPSRAALQPPKEVASLPARAGLLSTHSQTNGLPPLHCSSICRC